MGAIWRYGMALHKLHASPAAASPFSIPPGAVVVATHSPEWTLCQVVDVTLPVEKYDEAS